MSLSSWHVIEIVTVIAAIAVAVLLVFVIKALIAGYMKHPKAADEEIDRTEQDQ